ncbi:MAG: prephenate dehydrogenase/arogenate dehydrogenase family protein [Micavibrio sp.]|nr:prephenate dehydrogenase/arogenate dehydrogenase family protein [Micavibrio sp.]
MKISIIGRGVFGSFLAAEFAPHAEITDDADIVIIAVPVSAVEDVAKQHAGKHLVNVCSVQRVPNEACERHSARVTGIHPMFGPQSPVTNRSCVATLACAESEAVFDLFRKIGSEIITHHNGKPITGRDHDEMMRKTHLPVLMFGELAALIVEQAKDVPDNCLPTSFKRLKALAEQMKDMSAGTVESIRSNL